MFAGRLIQRHTDARGVADELRRSDLPVQPRPRRCGLGRPPDRLDQGRDSRIADRGIEDDPDAVRAAKEMVVRIVDPRDDGPATEVDLPARSARLT